MSENWKPVPGHPTYEVSDQGRVRSTRGHLLTPWRPSKANSRPRATGGRTGYLRVALSTNGKRSVRSIHSLVLEAHVGPRPVDHDGDHVNHDPLDNRLSNLRWRPAPENRRDIVRSHA